jgi:hypothetical protein
MIHISLTKERIGILYKRKTYTLLPFILPIALAICKIIKSMNKEYGLQCGIYIRINNTIDLEVKNGR